MPMNVVGSRRVSAALRETLTEADVDH